MKLIKLEKASLMKLKSNHLLIFKKLRIYLFLE